MRRLHNLLGNFGTQLTATAVHFPVDVAAAGDNSTLRWVARVGANHSGWIFLNNYERIKHLPHKTDVRLQVKKHSIAY